MAELAHPIDIWREGMDEAALTEWLVRRHAFVSDAWERGDMDATVTAVDPDFTLVNKRTLGGEGYVGRDRYAETFSLSASFPFQRQEILTLAPPNLAVVRNTLSDHDGNELVTVWAMRFRRGLLAEWVVFDDEPGSQARAEAELERMATS